MKKVGFSTSVILCDPFDSCTESLKRFCKGLANPKGVHLSYNNIDPSIFDQKDKSIEDYRGVASFSTIVVGLP